MELSNEQWSERWDSFIQEYHPGAGFMQRSWWVDLVSSDDDWNYFDAFNLSDNGQIFGGAKVFSRVFAPGKAFLYIPDGPLLSSDDSVAQEQFQGLMGYIDEWARSSQDLKITHLRLEPEWVTPRVDLSGFEAFDGWMEPRATRCVDLTQSVKGLMKGMNNKGRSRIKKAVSSGVTYIEDMSPGAVNDFLDIYHSTMERKGLEAMDEDYHRKLISTLIRNDAGSLCFAEYQGQRLATAMVIYHGSVATYFFAGSRDDHRQLMAPYLLNFMIMISAKFKGATSYDLYGIAPNCDKSHPWAGFTEFKSNFGGEEVIYTPALDRIYDDNGYAQYLEWVRD